MTKLLGILAVIMVLGLGGGYVNRVVCLSDDGPQLAVKGYLDAMQQERFEDAYQFVTANMTDAKPVDEWAETQRDMYKIGKVVINDIDIRGPQRQLTNPFMCAPVAKVPNVLHASDVLNNQGSVEFEVYTVNKADGTWQIDSQETLFDEQAINEWFPGATIPTFKGTLPSEE